MSHWLILDCPNLMWRAFYATKGIRDIGSVEAGTFGFLRSILTLQEIHLTDRLVFCFDRGASLRREVLKTYKTSRQARDALKAIDERRLMERYRKAIDGVADDLLPSLGYNNILYQTGYEADDMIAGVVNSLGLARDTSTVVSSDKDLYQLLSDYCWVYNPGSKRSYTVQDLQKEYKVNPHQWPVVKAIAGCAGDDVPGVPGVGEKTAAKYLNKELKADSRLHKRIEEMRLLWEGNLPLVRLPYKGVKRFVPKKDNASRKRWRKVLEERGWLHLLERDVVRCLAG